jgi:septal ring factor EnvC (AmiA/AmiB activator)
MHVPDTKDVTQALVGSAWDTVAGTAHGLSRFLGSAGAGAVTAAPVQVKSLLAGVLTLLDQLPSITGELEVLVQEVHAQRLSLQAIQAQLEALDTQLAVLEKSLAPVSAWSHQMSRLRASLTDLLAETQDGSGEPNPV